MTRNLALLPWRFWVCWALDARRLGLDAQQVEEVGTGRNRSPARNPRNYSSDLSAPWAGCGSES
jgi:hypothetical protein